MEKGRPYLLDSKFFVYRHIRKDLNKPFYIGVGTVSKKGFCNRAFSTKRNIVWHRVNSLTDVEVQIIYETNDYKEALLKEVEFISLYGRVNLKNGILVNLTDGGEGNLNPVVSESTRIKFRNRQLGSKHSKETIHNMKLAQLKRYEISGISPKAVKIYQYNVDGFFVKEWPSAMHADIGLKFNTSGASKALKRKNNCYKGNFFFYEFKGDKISIKKTDIVRCKVQKLDLYNNIISVYDSVSEARNDLNLLKKRAGCNEISACCKGNMDSYKGYKWRYCND